MHQDLYNSKFTFKTQALSKEKEIGWHYKLMTILSFEVKQMISNQIFSCRNARKAL